MPVFRAFSGGISGKVADKKSYRWWLSLLLVISVPVAEAIMRPSTAGIVDNTQMNAL